MGEDNPLVVLGLLVAAAVAFRWWLADWRAARAGTPAPQPLPGATDAPARAVLLAATGGFVIVGAETAGEYALGVSGEQSRVTVLFSLYTLAAAFVEELIFRGYIVVDRRGAAARWAGVLGASVLFALLHPFLWQWRDGALHFQFGAKGWFSTGAVFAASLWFYIVRFWPLNPAHSLWPCIAAHAAKNAGVFAVKLAQGHVGGWW